MSVSLAENEAVSVAGVGLRHRPREFDRVALAIPKEPIERFLNTLVDHSKRTKKTYRAYLHMIQDVLKIPLEVATLDEICLALNWFEEHYSDSSYAVCKAALRGFLGYLKRPYLVKYIKNKGVRWIPKRGPTAEQIDLLLQIADFRERVLILALYSTGLRISELLGDKEKGTPPVCVEDIDWGQGLVYFTGKGGNRECAVFFIRREQAMSILKLWLNGRTSGPIFKLSPSHAWRLLDNLGKCAGIKLAPHLLRHSTARSVRKGGGDIFDVQAQLRLRRIENALAYEHSEPLDLIERAREREWR